MILDGSTVTDTAADHGWVPVRVTAVMRDPVVNLDAHPFHLDGPAQMAAFLHHQATEGACSLPPLTAQSCTDFPLPVATWTSPVPAGCDPHPLATTGDGLAWGWACSRAHYGQAAHVTVNVRKRPETDAAARYSPDKSWNLGQGPLKARDVPFGAVAVREVWWDALADPAALGRLLAPLPGIGKLARQGNGAVLRWRVEAHDDRRAWADRVFPMGGGAPGSIRAPYWHRSREMPCTP